MSATFAIHRASSIAVVAAKDFGDFHTLTFAIRHKQYGDDGSGR